MTTLQEPEKEIVFISFDVEATGESPESGNMNMIGFTVVKEDMYKTIDTMKREDAWYIDKKGWCIHYFDKFSERCKREFWDKYPVNLRYIKEHGKTPDVVAFEISEYLRELRKKYRYYLIADPASFDWQFFNTFYDEYGPSDKIDIGYKSICMDGMEKALGFLGIPFDTITPTEAFGCRMTHLADDDSEYQAYQYLMLLRVMNQYKALIADVKQLNIKKELD